MKHLAIIQRDFLKIAKTTYYNKWWNMPLLRQQMYLEDHPKSKKQISGKPTKRKRRKPKIKHLKTFTHLTNQLPHKTMPTIR
jgi:hypothetical protein